MTVSILHATTTAIIGGTQWNEEHNVTGLATVAETGAYSDLSGTPTLAAVALSGAYSDLSGAPTENFNLTGIVTSVGNATSIANGAISYTKLANGTDGELLTWDASGVIATVAVGTSGHVLTSNGAGAAPTFQAVSATDITVADTTDTTCFFGLWESATGSQSPKSDGAATYDASIGKATFTTVAGFMEPAATTTTVPSILMASGTLMTTPSAGAVEMDATNIYGCTDSGNRGYIPLRQLIRCDSTRTMPNDTNENPIFNSPANGTLTLETGTYLFQGLISLTGMSATSGNMSLDIAGAGTATTGAWLWQVVGIDSNTPYNAAARNGSGSVTSQSPTSMFTAATGTGLLAQVYGTFEVTGAGTIIPSGTLVTASATAVVAIGSHLIFERIGTDSVVSVGNWT